MRLTSTDLDFDPLVGKLLQKKSLGHGSSGAMGYGSNRCFAYNSRWPGSGPHVARLRRGCREIRKEVVYMSLVYRSGPEPDAVVVDLKDPRIAAVLAWLWPGAGHFYQGRFVKGFIFMVCILGVFLYGMGIGRGRPVYASLRPNDVRWQFFLQVGVGGPALFAVAQSIKVKNDRPPFFVLCERYPKDYVDADGKRREFEIIEPAQRAGYSGETIRDGLMAPPKAPVEPQANDVLGMWHAEMFYFYDLAVLFTMVAGALNFLAVYDAWAGPAIVVRRDDEPGKDSG